MLSLLIDLKQAAAKVSGELSNIDRGWRRFVTGGRRSQFVLCDIATAQPARVVVDEICKEAEEEYDQGTGRGV